MPVFRVTPPYLHLLVTTRLFFGGGGGKFWKNIIYAFWKMKCLLKCMKLYFFQKKKIKKSMSD